MIGRGDATGNEVLRVDREQRNAATEVLASIGDSQAIGPLTSLLTDVDHSVRIAAVKALHQLGWTPAKDETGAAYYFARHDWSGCITIGVPAIKPLIAEAWSADYPTQESIAGVLAAIGTSALEPLLNALG